VVDADFLYFHSYMSDYFLGTYGGGVLKPFRYTEIQKHTFHLKSKDDIKDRQVPVLNIASVLSLCPPPGPGDATCLL
jgi:hypothetical protein